MIVRASALSMLASCQPGDTYAEQPTTSFDPPLVVMACSESANPANDPKLLIGAARLDGHSVVRLGGMQPGWWLVQSARLVDQISYYGVRQSSTGSDFKIQAAGQTFGHNVEVEYTMSVPTNGQPTGGSVIIREDGVEHRGTCVPFTGRAH